MLAGDYPTAIRLEHQALEAAAPGSLTQAYALYDLGRSLVLSGQPQAAIPILQERLKIPDQTDVVQQTLNQALAAAGVSSGPGPPNGGAGLGDVHGNGHHGGPGEGHGNGNPGGPGPPPGHGNGGGHGGD